MVRKAFVLAGFSALILAFAATDEAGAQTMPERFRGVWQGMEGKAGTCKRSDWNGDAHTDMHIRVGAREIDFHESACRFASIQPSKLATEDGAIRLTLACKGEGETWRRSQIWQVRRVAGHAMLVTTDIDHGEEMVIVYQRCG